MAKNTDLQNQLNSISNTLISKSKRLNQSKNRADTAIERQIVEIEIKEFNLIIDYLNAYNRTSWLLWMLCVKKDDLITNFEIKVINDSYNIDELITKIINDSKLSQSLLFLISFFVTLAVILIALGTLSFCFNHIGTGLKVSGAIIFTFVVAWLSVYLPPLYSDYKESNYSIKKLQDDLKNANLTKCSILKSQNSNDEIKNSNPKDDCKSLKPFIYGEINYL